MIERKKEEQKWESEWMTDRQRVSESSYNYSLPFLRKRKMMIMMKYCLLFPLIFLSLKLLPLVLSLPLPLSLPSITFHFFLTKSQKWVKKSSFLCSVSSEESHRLESKCSPDQKPWKKLRGRESLSLSPSLSLFLLSHSFSLSFSLLLWEKEKRKKGNEDENLLYDNHWRKKKERKKEGRKEEREKEGRKEKCIHVDRKNVIRPSITFSLHFLLSSSYHRLITFPSFFFSPLSLSLSSSSTLSLSLSLWRRRKKSQGEEKDEKWYIMWQPSSWLSQIGKKSSLFFFLSLFLSLSLSLLSSLVIHFSICIFLCF